jgi:hypothetical protein
MFGEASGFVAPVAGRLPAAKLALSGVQSVSRCGTECVFELKQSILSDRVVARPAARQGLCTRLSQILSLSQNHAATATDIPCQPLEQYSRILITSSTASLRHCFPI